MFICDEVLAETSPAKAAARLGVLACGSTLTRASHTAWETAITAAQASPGQVAPRLVRVHRWGPVHMDAVPLLILRLEAAAGNAQPFPALDADITLVPNGDHSVLLSLAGVYRAPPGTRPDPVDARKTAAVTARVLLSRIADAISDPAPPAAQPSVPGALPGRLACASPRITVTTAQKHWSAACR